MVDTNLKKCRANFEYRILRVTTTGRGPPATGYLAVVKPAGSLRLRSFDFPDADRLFEILSKPGVLDYFPPRPPLTRDGVERMIGRILQEWKENGYGVWAIEVDGRLAGRGGLQYLPETDETEVDFIIDPDFWGRGLATAVGEAALRFGFGELGVSRIIGLVHPDNAASSRVLEKIGMTLDCRTEYFGMVVDRYAIGGSSAEE